MRKILTAVAFLCFAHASAAAQDFVFPTAADYPKIKKSAKTCEDFVPPEFRIVKKAVGDLNRDQQPDCFLAIKGGDARFLNENSGALAFDTNPRVLLILFKEKTGYRLAQQSDTFIRAPESATMEEPFEDATIENNVLQLDFQHFLSAGGWGAGRYLYKFRYQNNRFALIGVDRMRWQRNTGDYEDRSYNFLSGKVKTTIGNNSEERPQKTSRRAFKLKRLKTLNTFKRVFGWEIEPNVFV